MSESVSLRLAQYAAATSIDKIPEAIRERAKKVILDEMASSHFGRRSLGGDLAARYAATLGGPAEATILGTGLRVPAQHAALANGSAGHGEEVDGAKQTALMKAIVAGLKAPISGHPPQIGTAGSKSEHHVWIIESK